MNIQFTKMHALGNDFMIIDGVRQKIKLTPQLIQQWGDRHLGIGFDQLLLVEPTQNQQADFKYRIFNADGGEVAQCGNGARCLARFLHEEKLTTKNPVTVETLAGLLELKLEKDNAATVNLGVPIFEPKKIPFIAEQEALTYPITVDGKELAICALSIGNPHGILLVDAIEKADVAELGSQLSHHSRFPERANVEFMQIVNPQHIRLRVYERGVGETLACGSGACAAVIAGRLLKKLDENVTVELPGGNLAVSWQGLNKPVFLTGPTVKVYCGKL